MSPPVCRVFLCEYIRVYMWKNRHLGDARRRVARLLSRLSRIFSAHFLTARRTARYGDQMRADRVSSIVYTLKKPLLLTSREEYHDLLPSAFDPRAPSLSVLCLSLCTPGSLWISHQKGTARRETAFILSRMSFISANRPRTTVFDSQRVTLNYRQRKV